MTQNILLTGGTGFLGTQLASKLVSLPDVKIYALVRAKDSADGMHRLRSAWQNNRLLCEQIGSKVFPAAGDFTKQDLGLSLEDRSFLAENITYIIHAGAETGFQKSRQDMIKTNYTGTDNMLSFARNVKDLKRFVYVSTAYVAGSKTGVIMEEEPDAEQFSGFYEQTKAKAEMLVRKSGIPFVICRPGMIVGSSADGWARNFNTVYYVLKLFLLDKLPVIPARADSRLNIVPADYVADSIAQICFAPDAEGMTFHLTCPADMAPTAEEMTEHVMKWAEEKLSISIRKPVFLPFPGLKRAGARHNNARKKEGHKNYVSNLLTLMPYFYAEQIFDRANTDRFCGPYSFRWQDYIDSLLSFACRKNFMRQTGQTVFEQAMVRRESTRYPILYHDISAEGISTVSGQEVNRMIRRITGALLAWGVRKGDRVALTGINSVDYLALEQSIGLTGAVSVPIYYTTPAAEASILLQKSGAKWFFVGDKRMMKQLPEIDTDAQIITFSAAEEEASSHAMHWKDFLERSDETLQPVPPDPDDLATIRYTSGTTGEPKGVMFSFRQLVWMGEVLSNLVGWKERNDYVSYLSFLPLSHVVEGILASYAPYYLLAKVDYYYLNDFSALTEALPKVRPTIFFSVPRFYEKVWDQVMANPLGQRWLKEKEGPVKTAMAAVLRKAVLRKAGIDRCKQLIVGSAPVSEALLLHFRSLGIEIYNAYGQTEAPLITINRVGDNVIPTIGTPLPDTTVTAEEDGELIVEGPQVTLGYYGLETDSIRNGVLRTGDLGVIHENGHITLNGRKKDFIITAYGKNISIPKIEEKLKDIPGVSEAVLIGENRPYCTALLWTEHEISDLDEHIARMNAELSHPEQIRKVRVIERPLSIQAGELTPNLKVKRANVQEHFAAEIEELYR